MHRGSLLCVLLTVLVMVASFPLPAETTVPLNQGTEPQQTDASSINPGASAAASASPAELEAQGDVMRLKKSYLDAIDYYRAALHAKPHDAHIYNKVGIAELLSQRFRESTKYFQRSIANDRRFADPYNNLGVIDYALKKYGRAIKSYKKAIALEPYCASFYSNLGAAYFSEKQFENATGSYAEALRLDPAIFEHSSHAGVTAQLSSPQDRAHYDYVLARLYAKMGVTDRSLEYLRRALEEGYKGVDNAYKDPEFATLRRDVRFTQLMSARPPAISEVTN